jgi:hypothetical protein
MNKNIKELYWKCNKVQGDYSTGGTQVLDAEEFANLIVKECIKQCILERSQILVGMNTDFSVGKDMGMEVCIDAIKEHFGIE